MIELTPTLGPTWHVLANVRRIGASRQLAFLDYQETDYAFFDLFVRLRCEQIVP